MPYKDVEKQRKYQRSYKRRRRARLASPFKRLKVYICPRHPFLNLGPGLRFENGFLVTSDPELQTLLEGNFDFWKLIFPLTLDYDSIPIPTQNEE